MIVPASLANLIPARLLINCCLVLTGHSMTCNQTLLPVLRRRFERPLISLSAIAQLLPDPTSLTNRLATKPLMLIVY